MSIGKVSTYRLDDGYELVCWGYSTSNSWGHEARLLQHGYELGSAKIRYYNRTWEAFKYQSVMLNALADYKEQELARYLDNYKLSNNLKGYDTEKGEEWEKPFPRGVKQQLVDEFNAQPIWAKLHETIYSGSWKNNEF